MQINSELILKTIFFLKGQLRTGVLPDVVEENGVQIAPFLGNAKAAVCISADFELNWAWKSLSENERDFKGAQERQNIPLLISIFEKNNIPITWATVGQLFYQPSDVTANQRINSYSTNPYTDKACCHLWHCPDLINIIKNSSVKHEFGCHTFTHLDLSLPQNTENIIENEIKASIDAMEHFGLNPKSFVFPYNHMDYRFNHVLAKNGITCVRHRDPYVRLSYPVYADSGLYKLFESMNLRKAVYYSYLKKAQIFLSVAKSRHAVLHLWFHPSDPPSLFINELDKILELFASERDKGNIWIATMSQVCAYVHARRTINLKVERTATDCNIFINSDYDAQRFGDTQITLLIRSISNAQICQIWEKNNHQKRDLKKWSFDASLGQIQLSIPSNTQKIHLSFLHTDFNHKV